MRFKLLASVLAVVTVAASLAATGDSASSGHQHEPKNFERAARVPEERLGPAECVDGVAADIFPCENIDLVSFVPYGEVAGETRQAALGAKFSEAWGWVDPETDIEYVLVGKTNGTAIFSLEDPTNPTYLGEIVNPSPAQLSWFDIKTIGNTAVITSESVGYGLQTFDLTRLRGVTESQTWTPDGVYLPNIASHNVAVNEESGFAYLVGSNGVAPVVAGVSGTVGGIEPCNGGIHAVDLSSPSTPIFAGCFSSDAYTHDAQCVTYHGPDEDYTDHEICVAYNEDTVTIVDFTDKLNPVQVSRFTYEMAAYTHQGWFTEDQRYIVFNDEGDEQDHGIGTRTLIADLADLDEPVFVGGWERGTTSIDHNNYIKDGIAYQSNYTTGLRIVDLDGIATAELEEIAWFDTFPQHDNAVFSGTWGNWPYFPSGHIVISSGVEGMFVVKADQNVLDTYADPFEANA